MTASIDTLSELLAQEGSLTIPEICGVVRNWLVVRSSLAFELGGGDIANILDRAAHAAVR